MDVSYIDKLAWLYIKDRKILGARSRNQQPFYIPGGKRESGEDDLQALSREVSEEFGVQLLEGSAKYYGTFEAQAHGKLKGIVVRMTCYTADFTGDIKPQAEVEELGWLSYADRNTEKCTPVGKLILEDLKAKNLID